MYLKIGKKRWLQKGGNNHWDQNFLPYPLKLFDDDLEDNVGVILADHDIFKKTNKITDQHFGVGVWGAGDFMADAPHEVKPPWKPLITDKSNKWPLVVGAAAGSGYVVFNSLQILQSLGRTSKKEVAEVLQNFLFWHGPLVVRAEGKIATTWAKLKR